MNNLFISYSKSPLGYLKIICNSYGVLSLNFVDKMEETPKPNIHCENALIQLDEYFKGIRKHFSLNLILSGTPFQIKVWNSLTKISYGKTISYKDIAIYLGNENSSRAVGNANNKNKLPIFIPCHRVIGKNNNLTGYSGGLWRKQWLINHEKEFL